MPLEKTPRGFSSSLASTRYRTIIPSAGLQKLGWDSRITYVPITANRRTLLERFEGASAVVFGKLAYSDNATFEGAVPRLLALASGLRSRGVKLIADFSDDRMMDPVRGPVDRQLANVVDMMVASTPQLADVMRSVSAVPLKVVTDPVEGARGVPRDPAPLGPHERHAMPLLWFGHWGKLNGLPRCLEQLGAAAATTPFSLILVTAPNQGAERIAAECEGRWRDFGSSCRFTAWSVEAVFEELQRCHAVIIPSDPYNPHNAVKSHNRFTESLWAGRFVIAHPLPAYQALAEYGWVGEDLSAGLSSFVADQSDARSRILAGQDYIAQRFAPTVVAESWRQVIMETLKIQ